jgi:hypothetical protein
VTQQLCCIFHGVDKPKRNGIARLILQVDENLPDIAIRRPIELYG